MKTHSDETSSVRITGNADRPPHEAGALASWFAQAVRSELAALEKDGGAQRFEVLSGKLVESKGPMNATFHFIIADGTRLPEDATGKLETPTDEYVASVIGQQANRIHLHIEGKKQPPPSIPRAILIIDDTALLRKLAEVLEKTAADPRMVGPLATAIFHPNHIQVASANLNDAPILATISEELLRIIKQACGSPVTYVWGPPGTGKTHLIAHLIAALVETGERVLVTSHTHAAVDQALYAAVKADGGSKFDEAGPLAGHALIEDGKILRLGRTADPKVPDIVRFDKVMEMKAKDLEVTILELEATARPLAARRARCRSEISEWDKLKELTDRLQAAWKTVNQTEVQRRTANQAMEKSTKLINERREGLERAKRAWLLREARTARATNLLRDSDAQLREAEDAYHSASLAKERGQRFASEIETVLAKQRAVCETLPPRGQLEREMADLQAELGEIEEKIRGLQNEISELEKRLIADARAMFCTLTKCYVGKELEEQRFDAVIVDEISMALPPLIFLAAARAASRVILVGDFLQLPPIIRSDSEMSNTRLREDIFHLAGVAQDLEPAENCPVLTKLQTQRRMLPSIADVARHLVYGPDGIQDHVSVLDRMIPKWLECLPSEPLIIVDTADLHCWSGKQPGSLSRFNFYTATLSVELAAMAATNLPEPDFGEAPPIGIVTPFAAQRRLLSKLVEEMKLDRWVAAGTVHTFQGGSADVIIFDSVLDEPYWAARLTAPGSSKEVKRDLNVAVTRAKNKFIFVGSSDWLNKHARAASALGQMWSFIKERAILISAVELVDRRFLERVSDPSVERDGWEVPYQKNVPTHEILDEVGFFERFERDLALTSKSIFGLVPFFGEYRWPRIQPLFAAALARGVEVTLVTPPLSEAENRGYVEKTIRNLRDLGAVVVSASGLHGKDIVIDERVHYTGSLNWASHRGRAEVMHRTESPALAKLTLEYMQARFIRNAVVSADGKPRVCPDCGGPTQIINQRQQYGHWDYQALKVGCVNYQQTGCKYLRDIVERLPLGEIPRCQIDGRTKYRRVRQRRGEVWQCPKHPKKCPTQRVVPGDPD